MERDPGWDVLYIRGDEFAKCTSDRELVEHGLPADFIAKCAALAQGRRVLVVIDSLDVLSLHGEHQSLRALLSVVDRLLGLMNITCVLACRTFDLNYDALLRDRTWDRKIALRPLNLEADILPFLNELGIASSRISAALGKLLVVPQNLRLFTDLAVTDPDPAPWDAIGDDLYALHAHFLNTVVLRDTRLGDEALDALQALATKMLEHRTLRVSRTAVDLDERRLRHLISQGILVEAGGQTISLGHQTLLDALVVREAMANSQSLVSFIRDHPPFPFIRPVVHAFVRHLRPLGEETFGREVRNVLDAADIPYHLRRAVTEWLAEIQPTKRDWPLIRHIFSNHRDSFERLLGCVRGPAWFHLLREQWWPALPASPDSEPSRARFIAVLARWMNDFPDDVLALWKSALGSTWGERNNIPWSIQIQLKDFAHWEVDGVEDLLRDLFQRLGDKNFLGRPISKFVEATGRGLDLVWQFITKDVGAECEPGFERALRCDDHDFGRKGFLLDLLTSSDIFLELTIKNVEAWSTNPTRLDSGSLYNTAWAESHTATDVRDTTGHRRLMDAIGEALRRRAEDRAPLWCVFDVMLRRTRNLGLRYLLIQAYTESVDANIDGITTQLLDEDLAECGQLDYELGELVKKAYPALPAAVQDQHQEMLLRHYDKRVDRHGDDVSTAHATYVLLQPIPAIFRTPSTQQFLDRWERQFGIGPWRPHLTLRGGLVQAPIDTTQLMRLTASDLERLLKHYENTVRSEWLDGSLIGGRDEVCRVLGSAASHRPLKYLELAHHWWRDGRRDEYIKAVIDGASSHLQYRFGNLTSPNGWMAEDPPPDSELVIEQILACIERCHSLWMDERAMARALEGCADATTTFENAVRVTWLLIRLKNATEPEVERVRFDPHKRTEPEARDLMIDSMNTARGIAADAAMTLASRLAELGLPLPDLLIPTLKSFASDAVASVRASVLRSIPYFLQKHPDVGWDLIARTLEPAHPQLWEFAERTFYYGIGKNFERVSPYLQKILEQADVAGETWGRLATLGCLDGKVELDAIFVELQRRDLNPLWTGAAQVFASNLDKEGVAGLCRSGLLRILKRRPVPEHVIGLVDQHLRSSSAVDMSDIVTAVLNAYSESSSRVDLMGVCNWVAVAVNRDPVGALPLLERLLSGFEARTGEPDFIHSESLIAALLAVLREADQLGDEALVRRALSLQDTYLRLNVEGIEDMLDAAASRS